MYTYLDVFSWGTTRGPNVLKHSHSIVYSLKPIKAHKVADRVRSILNPIVRPNAHA